MGVLSIMRVMVFVENADENIFLPLFFGSCCLLCHFAAHDDDSTTEEEQEEEEETTFVVAGVSISTSFSSS